MIIRQRDRGVYAIHVTAEEARQLMHALCVALPSGEAVASNAVVYVHAQAAPTPPDGVTPIEAPDTRGPS